MWLHDNNIFLMCELWCVVTLKKSFGELCGHWASEIKSLGSNGRYRSDYQVCLLNYVNCNRLISLSSSSPAAPRFTPLIHYYGPYSQADSLFLFGYYCYIYICICVCTNVYILYVVIYMKILYAYMYKTWSNFLFYSQKRLILLLSASIDYL